MMGQPTGPQRQKTAACGCDGKQPEGGHKTGLVLDHAGLRAANRTHLLCGADGADAHADAEAVRSGL